MIRCGEIMAAMERIAPKRYAEDWDNHGLLTGDPAQEVKKILLCLDVSERVIEKAVEIGAEMIISHHPMIFKPVKKIRTDTPLGRKLRLILKNDIAVFAAHTNLDKAAGGVNDLLAEKLGLTEVKIFPEGEEIAFGRIGRLAEALPLEEFARRVKDSLNLENLRLVPGGKPTVKKIALCGGSSGEFIPDAAFLGADAYVGGDIRYHDAEKAAEMGINVIDAGHFGTEFPVVERLYNRLSEELAGKDVLIERDTDAADYFKVM